MPIPRDRNRWNILYASVGPRQRPLGVSVIAVVRPLLSPEAGVFVQIWVRSMGFTTITLRRGAANQFAGPPARNIESAGEISSP